MKNKKNFKIYENCVKRILDVFFSCLLLVALSWLFIFVAIIVKINYSSPVIFRQKRAGKDEKIFVIYKFRTMSEERDQSGNLLPDEMRTTKIGKFLRSTSLDELPELVNVLKGDMSFVGPRPLLAEYLPFYTKEERLRHSVRPGMTGLAQVNGRNNVESWEKRFEYDLEYVNNIKFSGDVKIVFKNFRTVLFGSGVELDGGIKEGPLDKVRGEKDEK